LFGWTIPALGWGVHGAWIAMVSEIVARALLLAARFVHGGWRHVKV
jgi:Na+-driven multidrug efflux pump